MVFKPFANLARQGITKHLVNGGYAQSVVAASQSLPIIKVHASPARVTNFGPSRAHSTQTGQSHDSTSGYNLHNGQLFDEIDKDPKRYLFSKKILWSNAQHQTQELATIPTTEEEVAQQSTPSPVEASDAVAETTVAEQASAESQSATVQEAASESVTNEVTAKPSPADLFNAELEKLKLQGRFKDITVVFDHHIRNGLQPNTETFNYLLSAVAQLMRLEVLDNRVSHLLGVYSDLLHRNLTPNTRTYSILLTSLVKCARRKHAVQEIKAKELNRFGYVTPSPTTLLGPQHEEADGVDIALDLFYTSTSSQQRQYSVDVYSTLIEACSQLGRTDDMLKIFSQMESIGVKPSRDTYIALIDGFGKAKDLHSAIEVYEEVKTGLEKDKTGYVPQSEKDRLYKHLVMAYIQASEAGKALAFFSQVEAQLAERSNLVIEGFVEGFIRTKEFSKAMDWIAQFSDSTSKSSVQWTITALTKAADAGDYEVSRHAYQNLLSVLRLIAAESHHRELDWHPRTEDILDAKAAYLTLCTRTRRFEEAKDVWAELSQSKSVAQLDVYTTLTYVKLLFDNGCASEALQTVANMISHLESRSNSAPVPWGTSVGWKIMIDFLSARGFLTSDVAGEIWRLAGSTYLTGECIRPLIAACNVRPLPEMTLGQLELAVQLNACLLLAEGRSMPLPEDAQRFEYSTVVAMRTIQHMSPFTKDSVHHAIRLASSVLRPEFMQSWHEYTTIPIPTYAINTVNTTWPTETVTTSPTLVASEGSSEEFDPYRQRVDLQASNHLELLIDKKRSIADIVKVFRKTRDAHLLKYTTIAKIISYATRSGSQREFCNEVFEAAKKDMPLLPEYSAVRYGWCHIYDAMIAACLNTGEHQRATQLRDEMAQIGGVPSANTYGLFIVNLGQSHETSDEASEAVKLFEQSKAQNVYPTPFLYNAVIGKLSKARRVDDCLFYYSEMRGLGLKPTSVTYGTMINALCRVSDERYAEELFQEMESMPNYKPRAAPYNSMIQFFAITKRDRTKVLQYYNRMLTSGIEPTGHTYKLLIDAYASLDPPDIKAAEGVMELMKSKRIPVECIHHASLIHAKGCVLHDVTGAIAHFEKVLAEQIRKPDAILYQALFEALVANHKVSDTGKYIERMQKSGVDMTPYIANTLIHGWALEKNIEKSKSIYDALGKSSSLRREPSTYEAMTRAYLAVEDRNGAMDVVKEMLNRGYPTAVMSRILDLVKGGSQQPIVV